MYSKLGISPIGWSNDDFEDLGGDVSYEQCLEDISKAGYKGCEIGTNFPSDIKTLEAQLIKRDIQVCNKWFGFHLTTTPFETVKNEFEAHLRYLRELNIQVVSGAELGYSTYKRPIPALNDKKECSIECWQLFTRGLNALGKLAGEYGIRLAYHPHVGTIVQSTKETQRLLDSTDPSNVFITYDSGHAAFAGEDPLAFLQLFMDRIAHVHLKDLRPKVLDKVIEEKMSFQQAVSAGVFTVPGDPQGSVDFKTILRELDDFGYDGWLVVEAEQDPAKAPPFEYAKLAIEYLKFILSTPKGRSSSQ